MFEIEDIKRVLALLEAEKANIVYIETDGNLRARFGHDGVEYHIPSTVLKQVGHHMRVLRHSTVEVSESGVSND